MGEREYCAVARARKPGEPTLRILAVFALLALLPTGCAAPINQTKPTLDNEGEILVFLQPVPPSARILRFEIEEIRALREDEGSILLAPSLREVSVIGIAGRQTQLASGIVPPGAYRGLSLKIGGAFLRGDEGEGALLVPEAPVAVVHPFKVGRGKAFALFLSMDPSKSVSEGFRFAPAFSLATPVRGLTSMAGYLSSPSSNSVFIFNKVTMEVSGVIATGAGPKGIVLDQDRKRVYVALSGSDAVEIIDTLSTDATGRIPLRPGDGPEELALSPDGRLLVCANYISGTASIIDAESFFEVGRVRVGEGPTGVAIDPSGLRAYVVNSLSGTISVVDLSARSLIATITVEGTPLKAAFNRSGDRLYAVGETIPDLLVLDPSALAVTERIPLRSGALSIKLDPQTDLAYVGAARFGEVAVVEPLSRMVVETIDVGGAAVDLVVETEENTLLALRPEEARLTKVSLVSKKPIGEMEVLKGAYAIVVAGER